MPVAVLYCTCTTMVRTVLVLWALVGAIGHLPIEVLLTRRLWTHDVGRRWVAQSFDSEGDMGLLHAGIVDVCLWSDLGPHYRANLMIPACCMRWPLIYQRDFHLRFGLEHLGSECCRR